MTTNIEYHRPYECTMCGVESPHYDTTRSREVHLITFHRVSMRNARIELVMRMFREVA
jgi:hypothetical protein